MQTTMIEKLATAKAVAEKDLKLIVPQNSPGVYMVDARIHLQRREVEGRVTAQLQWSLVT